MRVRLLKNFAACLVALFLLGACTGNAPVRGVGATPTHQCKDLSGRLRDTLFLNSRAGSFTVPSMRLPHLAVFPSAAAESTIRFQNGLYFPFGQAIEVRSSPSTDLLIRVGLADQVPIFVLREDMHLRPFARIWAPVTDDCIFLPFKHQSEMR